MTTLTHTRPDDPNLLADLRQLGEFFPYRLGRDVTFLEEDGVSRLLDLDRGRFYALNQTGTRLLRLTLQLGPTEAVRRVAIEYGAEEQRVHSDWKAMLGDLARKRLVIPAASRRATPGAVGLWLLLALAWLSFRIFGWSRTVRYWSGSRRARVEPWHEGLAPLVRRLDRAVRSAATSHPLNPQCKERAIVAWHVLRNRWALPAELVGVLAFPFQAHAWVECGPLTVTDERARCELYLAASRHR